MKLWIVSDLHLELTRGWDLPSADDRPDFDVMVVAGDLVPRMERGVRWLLERVTDRQVIYVAGNHESYGTDIDRTVEKAMMAAEGTNVHVLHDRTISIDEVTFAGATLWTDFAQFGDPRRAMIVAGARMNDYRRIRTKSHARRLSPADVLARHKDSRTFVESELRKPRGDCDKLVVVTHHAPLPDRAFMIAPPEPDEAFSDDTLLDAAYRSDLTTLMSPQPADGDRGALRPADLWIYGHTHESFDRTVGTTRVVSNAKGYGPWGEREPTWENRDFDPNLVIEI